MEGLGLSSRRHGQVVVVAVRGELDAVTSGEFDEYLTGARQQSDRIILDLTAVDFMDTSSLAVIVGHWKKLTARDGILALAGRRRPIPDAGRGHGLWVVNQLCDLVELRTGSTGTTVRLHMRLGR